MNKSYRLKHRIFDIDQLNDKGRALIYAEINVIASDPASAYEKAKVQEGEYYIAEVFELGRYWNECTN